MTDVSFLCYPKILHPCLWGDCPGKMCVQSCPIALRASLVKVEKRATAQLASSIGPPTRGGRVARGRK